MLWTKTLASKTCLRGIDQANRNIPLSVGLHLEARRLDRYAPDENCLGGHFGCRGQIRQVTNALGHVTRYDEYDAHGHIRTMTDPNGLVTTLTYTPRGWLETRDLGGELTRFDYDNVGFYRKWAMTALVANNSAAIKSKTGKSKTGTLRFSHESIKGSRLELNFAFIFIASLRISSGFWLCPLLFGERKGKR
jgi:YD repeat-containing protein